MATFMVLASCSAPGIEPAGRSGVEGVVTIGPVCPVMRMGSPCPDRPHQARVAVRDASGRTLQSFVSGQDGRFRVDLSPGDYVLVPEQGRPLPRANEVPVTVRSGAYTRADIRYDSGIR